MSHSFDQLKATIKRVADSDAAEHQAHGIATEPLGTPGNPTQDLVTPANIITFCRLLLTIAFLVLFCWRRQRYSALACYAVAASTDFLDGQVARRTQTVSWLGKIMDPIMDRLLLATGVLGLLVVGELPVWVPIFVIGRDAYLACGAMILQKYRTRPVDVVFIGKVTTALLMFGFCLCLLGMPQTQGLGLVQAGWLPGLNSDPAATGVFFVYAGCVCSAITAIVYTVQGIGVKREALERAAGN